MIDKPILDFEVVEATEHHGYYLTHPSGYTVCDLYFKEEKKIHHHVNAKVYAHFIAKACNNHYELLEALERILRVTSGITLAHSRDLGKLERAEDAAQIVLAKAKELNNETVQTNT